MTIAAEPYAQLQMVWPEQRLDRPPAPEMEQRWRAVCTQLQWRFEPEAWLR